MLLGLLAPPTPSFLGRDRVLAFNDPPGMSGAFGLEFGILVLGIPGSVLLLRFGRWFTQILHAHLAII